MRNGYKRFLNGIMRNPPPPYTCMVVVTNKGVFYSRIAFCITAYVDSTQAYAVCVKRRRDEKKEEY